MLEFLRTCSVTADMSITRQYSGKAKILKPAKHNAFANKDRKACRVATWLTEVVRHKMLTHTQMCLLAVLSTVSCMLDAV